jgi:neutral ceramidase
MTQIRAGASRSGITPPVGVDLAGYAHREGASIGVHDDLWCGALVLDDGRTRLALVALDLLETDFEADAMLRQAAAASAGIAPEHILINCSHTHAGPPVARSEGLGARNTEYIDFLRARVAETAATAASRLAPAALRHGSAPVRVGINRREITPDGEVKIGRNPAGLVDTRVRVIEVRGESGPGAVLFHHACHGTTLGQDNRRISAEWMGAAAARLAAESKGGSIPMFLQGCCGQINPDAEATFDEVDHLGAMTAAAVVAALAGAECLTPLPLAARMQQVELPFQDPLTPEEARAQLRRTEAEHERLQREGAHAYILRARESLVKHAARMLERAERRPTDDALTFAVQVLRIGDLAIVGLSGEVFLEFAQEIEARSPFPHTLVLGYANGCTCYIPTEEAFAEGGYEAVDSFRWYGIPPLAPEAGEVMVRAAVGVLNDLWGGDRGQ